MSERVADRLPASGLGVLDVALVVLFLLGIYTNYELRLTPTVPIPCTLSGIAGVVLLWRRRDMLAPNHVAALMIVMVVYLAAVFSATDYGFFSKRFTGWMQLVYSMVLGYALFLTVLLSTRLQLAALFLALCLTIVVGCLLETYAGLRQVSDAVRQQIYSFGVYQSDLRDEILYGKVRPKLFTSEPSSVTFAYTLFGFAWLVASPWRWKIPAYLALVAAGLLAMAGPTLLLMVILLVPYYLLLAESDARPHHDWATHWIKAGVLSVVFVAAFGYLATAVYSERITHILRGEDPSFFYRVIGPALVAFDVIERYPWAGAGLTGEPFIANDVLDVYVGSPSYSAAWRFDRVAEVLTNYFWLHWIYLGLVWGVLTLAAVAAWLRVLAPSDTLFAWAAWVVFGQASGAYVGPKTWTVLLLTLALAMKVRGEPVWWRRAVAVPERPVLAGVWAPSPHRGVWRS
ncbi:MAG: hypothetical protein L6R19_11890 [Alphaproteobacteria bacterium]|nr:hypothetical protein [Alphaproteobacteria bacterium]